MNKEQAREIIENKLDQIYSLRKECEDIAEKYAVSFHFDAPYGMGGWFYPDSLINEELQALREEALINNTTFDEDEARDDIGESGWLASSQSC